MELGKLYRVVNPDLCFWFPRKKNQLSSVIQKDSIVFYLGIYDDNFSYIFLFEDKLLDVFMVASGLKIENILTEV